MPDYSEGVTLITCTGDRPEAFELCRKYVERQTYDGPTQWLVVDDGQMLSCLNSIQPTPKWNHHGNTLARNLLAAIPEVRHQKVVFLEDDDHYSADYVATMAAELEHGVTIAGDRVSPYYHLPSRRYRIMENQQHASLCQTAIRAELLPVLADVCKQGGDFIDVRLWQLAFSLASFTVPMRFPSLRVGLPTGRVVGMKGLPGRPGIGIGHRPEQRPSEWKADPDLKVLGEWIGEDVKLYEEFLCQK